MSHYPLLLSELEAKGFNSENLCASVTDGGCKFYLHFNKSAKFDEEYVTRLIIHHRIVIQNIESTKTANGDTDVIITTIEYQ